MPRVAAIVHFDGARGGLGNARSASEPFLLGRTALGLTLERLSRCESLDGVIVLADDPAEARRVAGPMLENPSRGFARIEFVAWPGRDARRAAIAAGRLWAPACWRGGLGGLTCYDELSEPGAAAGALRERGFGAGVLVGADWALVDPALVDAVVRRHRESPEKYRVVFTQAAPGLAGCLVDVGILEELASQAETAGVFATIGGLLGYVPIAPQLDPIGKSVCVAAAPAVRDVNYRCIPDAEPRRRLLAEALVPLGARALDAGAEEIAGLVAARVAGHGSGPPQQVVLELCTGRLTSGRRGEWMRGFGEMIERPSMTPDLAERVLGPLCAARGDVAVTLAGAGDPLLHPGWREFVDLARRCGAAGVHVRTDLICGPEVLDALIESGVDVVSVDVMAMDAGTYRELMGVDRLVHVRGNVESLARRRGTGLGLPWIVPRMTRCDAVYGQVERFYDEHLMRLGAAVIDALPAPAPGERIEPLPWPEEAARRADLEAMTVLADGSAPAGMNDLRCEHPAANAGREGVLEAWRKVAAARRERWSGWPARKAG